MKQDSISEAYLGIYGILLEELHQELTKILDSDINPKYKLSEFTKKARSLLHSGQDSGLESDKPKKGSSRAVFFPKEPKKITVDGVETSSPTAVKIAFSGTLDKYHGEKTLLGEDQNAQEADNYTNRVYGILYKGDGENEYHTNNETGVLAPVFGKHDENHHLEMGRVSKFNTKDFTEATKNADYPKGITHKDMLDTLVSLHDNAYGNHSYMSEEREEYLSHIANHPFVDAVHSMSLETGMHPGDLAPRNMGIYTHPVTGKKHPVIIDYGFSNEIAQKYAKARRNEFHRSQSS